MLMPLPSFYPISALYVLTVEFGIMPPRSSRRGPSEADSKASRKAAGKEAKAPSTTPKDWSTAEYHLLKPELERRQLPQSGLHEILEKRLKASDAKTLQTRQGRQDTYKRQVKRLRDDALSRIRPFTQFKRFPFDIREYIWQLSLPGPRVLTLDSSQPLNSHKLSFSRLYTTPNPVALSVCIESRIIAQKRYKLAFGTSNIYADLPGGDILFFGPQISSAYSATHPLLDGTWEWKTKHLVEHMESQHRSVRHVPSPNLRMDLEAVTHIALSRPLWNTQEYIYVFTKSPAARDTNQGHRLRQRLRNFKNLELLSLEHAGFPDQERQCSDVFISTAVIDDPLFESKRNAKMAKLFSMFDDHGLSKEEIEEGIPEARIVKIKYVQDQPRRLWEGN